MILPRDNSAYRFPVSIKGVIKNEDMVYLLKNERDEWELPGGKLELNEAPEECLKRELHEELNVIVEKASLIDVWIYKITENVNVFIVTFIINIYKTDNIQISNEHKEGRWFLFSEIQNLNIPTGYKYSIQKTQKIK